MGACQIHVSATGMDIHDAFKNAQQEAEEYHGHQEGYSGAINCCSLAKVIKKGEYTLDEIEDRTSKREVWGYCEKEPIPNTNKTKSQVENNPQRGTRKWKTVFEIVNSDFRVVGEKDSQTEAIKKAREIVEKDPYASPLTIQIAKKLVEGNTKCATVRYKPSSTERPGTYVFIGWAPE